MTTLPINLNLALILHKLLQHPEGWSVEELMQEINISARTYRKYRKLLRDQLSPDLRMRLSEQRRQGQVYLTLSPLPQAPGAHARLLAQLVMGGDAEETRILRLDAAFEPDEHTQDILYALLSRRSLELTLGADSLTGDPLTLWSTPRGARLILRVGAKTRDIRLEAIQEIAALGSHFAYPDAYDPDAYIASRDALDDDD